MEPISYVFPATTPSVAVAGEAVRFPVRRIFCVGQNYAAHTREMGGDPDREPPFFFMKPADAVVDSDATIPYPPLTHDFQHEIELVVAMARGGADISAERALDHVFGYAAGIDLTRRDLQAEAKSKRRPWDWGKGFDHSAPCGPLVRTANVGLPAAGRIWLTVNGVIKQDADLRDLIWSVPDIIAAASRSMTLTPGDLIFTGTPAGVGPIERGDRVTGEIEGIGQIKITVAA